MDTLEAIAWVRLLTACLNSPAGCEIKEHKESLENCEKADEIVNMLQQGEALKAENIKLKKYERKYIEEKSFGALSLSINKFSKAMWEMTFTCEEIARRFILKDKLEKV